jgi:hypothetical protein
VKPPDILSDLSETEVYCSSGLVSDRTVALSDVNQNVAGGERNGEVENGQLSVDISLLLLASKLILAWK